MPDEAQAQSSLDKRVIRTSPILWVLGALLALFLGALGTRVLSDVADLFPEPDRAEFDKGPVTALRQTLDLLRAAPDPREPYLRTAERSLADSEGVLRSEEQAFRTWLDTRVAVGGTSGEDRSIRARRDRLDVLRKQRDDAERGLRELQKSPDPREPRYAELRAQIATAEGQAQAAYDSAHRRWTARVLLARLGVAVPLWGLAVLLWRRRERTRYPTLLWVHLAFAAWMLLYGAAPYLPHYGGYLPLGLGAAAVIGAAVSLVRFFNGRANLRRRRIMEAALRRHRCPGCEHDYLAGREIAFEAGLARKASVRRYDREALSPNACSACGLALFGGCAACGHRQSLYLDFCGACAAPFKAGDAALGGSPSEHPPR